MKLINKYLNGNVTVTLFDNGTKIQEWDDSEQPNPDYPVSMDIKITNMCDLGCPWCHEKSIPTGKHANLENLLDFLQELPKGTELAIGGGNPLDHPGLKPFLITCKSLGLVPNITVNGQHVMDWSYRLQLNELISEELIYGIGISIDDDFHFEIMNELAKLDNVVYHIIAGVNEISILNEIKKSLVKKVLVLGYKNFGRGENYMSDSTLDIIEEWVDKLGGYVKKIHLSFDNLAIKQLKVKDHLSEKEWNEFYMGDDGQFTMYIDAISEKYALSSISTNRYPLEGSMKEIFSIIKNE